MRFFSFVLTAALLFALGFSWRDVQSGKLPDPVAFKRLVGIETAGKQSPEQEFKQAYNLIQTAYYKPVKSLELKYAGISGMMASLGDPHTMFLVPQVAKKFDIDTKANYVGVGARLAPYSVDGAPVGARAAVVFETGPAYSAGLRRGDVVV